MEEIKDSELSRGHEMNVQTELSVKINKAGFKINPVDIIESPSCA